jgi:tetratricopeptide (TPR) repeat protein
MSKSLRRLVLPLLLSLATLPASATPAGTPRATGPGLHEGALRLAEALRAGDEALVAVTARQLAAHARTTPSDAQGVAAALLLAGEREQALAVLRAGGQHAAAFELLAAEVRHEEAFALLDDPRVRTAEAERRVQLGADAARALAGLGETERARGLLLELADDAEVASTPRLLAQVVSRAVQVGLVDDGFAWAASGLASLPPGDDGAKLAGALHPHARHAAEATWTLLRQRSPDADPMATLAEVDALLDPASDPDSLSALWREAAAADPAASRPFRARRLEGLAALAAARGDLRLEREIVGAWAELSGLPHAWMRLGDAWVEAGRWSEAADAYGKAAGIWRADAAPAWLQGWALGRAGQGDAGAQLRAGAVALSSDEGSRYRLGSALLQRRIDDEARVQLEAVLRDGREGVPAVAMAAQALAGRTWCAGEELEAARLYARARVLTLQRAPACLSLPSARALARTASCTLAHAAVTTRDLDGALRLAESDLEPFVADADLAADLVNALEAEGRSGEAETLFWRVRDRLDVAAAEFSRSAQLANAVAWFSARTRRDLDTALVAAERAVALLPDRPGLLDTLAEVRFQMGEVEAAIALEERAAALAPRRAFFAEQLARMRAGDAAVDPPKDR